MAKPKYEEMIPEDMKHDVRNFADRIYISRQIESLLPDIRTRHEAYGYLSECFAGLNGATATLKTVMNDALKMLSSRNTDFAAVSEAGYTAALDAAMAALNMAVHAQNIDFQLTAIPDPVELTPMEELAASPGTQGAPFDEELAPPTQEQAGQPVEA